jgi:hypothetical protein
MKILDVNTRKPLNPGDFGYDISEAVSVAIQMPKVWKLDDYTWYIAYTYEDACNEARQYDATVNLQPDKPLATAEMNELIFIRDDGYEVTFMDEYRRHLCEGTEFPALFASELV